MIELHYRPSKDDPYTIHRYADDRLDELLKRAEDKFCAPLTAEDLVRFDKITKGKK